ncbi:MAG: phospholipase A2 [Actinomycetota bacterium]
MRRLAMWATAGLMALTVMATPAVAGAQEQEPGVDGCTAVPDSGRLFDFTESCNGHDRCYRDRPYGNSSDARKQCDDEFYGAMVDSCATTWPDSRFRRSLCEGVAGVYWTGVRLFGGFGWSQRTDADFDAA